MNVVGQFNGVQSIIKRNYLNKALYVRYAMRSFNLAAVPQQLGYKRPFRYYSTTTEKDRNLFFILENLIELLLHSDSYENCVIYLIRLFIMFRTFV